MKRRRHTLKDYFNFTRNDRIAIIQLSGIILLITALPYLYSLVVRQPNTDFTAFRQQAAAATRQIYAAQMAAEQERKQQYQQRYASQNSNHYYKKRQDEEDDADFEQPINVQLHPFNPNQLTYTAARELGIPQRVAYTIENYLEKGGQFRHAEDLQKIYGMSTTDYERLLPYIQLPQKTKTNNTTTAANQANQTPVNKQAPNSLSSTNQQKNVAFFQHKDTATAAPSPPRTYKSNTAMIDMNTADSIEWQQIKGIGKSYANRIIKYRSLLGGYTAKEQLKEVFGMTDELYEQIAPHLLVPHPSKVKKIDINKATFEELNAHAYIRKYRLANPIIKYRQQHGAYQQANDLLKIQIISPEIFSKLAPYIVTQ